MNIFIYSDESGVFDKAHNHFFVFGGLIFLSKEEKDNYTRMYSHTEKIIREKESIQSNQEVKATTVSNSSKAKLFRSLNHAYKFGIVIHQEKVKDSIFSSKKTKQRYLDWAYKFAVRKQFESMISAGTKLFIYKSILLSYDIKRAPADRGSWFNRQTRRTPGSPAACAAESP